MHSTTCPSSHLSCVATPAADRSHSLGVDVDDATGDGPGSFDVRGNVWHLDCCNGNKDSDGNGWLIFGALTGWTNSATRKPCFSVSLLCPSSCYFHTVGTVLSYVFYWLAVIATLVVLKWREGRLRVFGFESASGKARHVRQEVATSVIHERVPPSDVHTDQISELPR
jgi:high-affinity iron transporter